MNDLKARIEALRSEHEQRFWRAFEAELFAPLTVTKWDIAPPRAAGGSMERMRLSRHDGRLTMDVRARLEPGDRVVPGPDPTGCVGGTVTSALLGYVVVSEDDPDGNDKCASYGECFLDVLHEGDAKVWRWDDGSGVLSDGRRWIEQTGYVSPQIVAGACEQYPVRYHIGPTPPEATPAVFHPTRCRCLPRQEEHIPADGPCPACGVYACLHSRSGDGLAREDGPSAARMAPPATHRETWRRPRGGAHLDGYRDDVCPEASGSADLDRARNRGLR